MLICWCFITIASLKIVSCYQNDYLLIFFEYIICIDLRHGCDRCYVIRGCTILRVVSRAAMDILFLRDISHAVIVTIIECRIARRDGCMNLGPRLRENRCVSLG